jgi:hypothetical protein
VTTEYRSAKEFEGDKSKKTNNSPLQRKKDRKKGFPLRQDLPSTDPLLRNLQSEIIAKNSVRLLFCPHH